MQHALMEHILKILLEVENLTANKRTHVQNGLASIQSDGTESSAQYKKMRYSFQCCLVLMQQFSLFIALD